MTNILAFLYQFAFIFYLYMGIRVLKRHYRSSLNRVFFLLCISLAVWSLSTGFMVSASTREAAYVWRKISTFGFCLMPAFFLHFFMMKTGFKPIFTCRICPYLLYIPGLFYVLATYGYTAAFPLEQFVREEYGWTFLSPANWLDWSYNAYYTIYFIVGFSLLVRWWYMAEMKREKKQASLIVTSLVLAFIMGSITDTILPFLQIPAPPLAVIIALIPASALWHTIEKYRFMGLSSRNIVTDILKNMGEGLFILDVDGRIREVSEETLELLASERKDIIMKPVTRLFPPHEAKRIPGLANHERWQDIRNVEVTLQRCDGKFLPVMFSTALIHDDWEDVLGIICTFFDIRRIKTAEAKKNEVLDRLDTLVNTMQQGILFEDEKGSIVYVNPFFCNLFGIDSPSDVQGKNCLEIAEKSKEYFENSEAFVQNIKDRLAHRKSILAEELRLKDGRVFERDYIPVRSKNMTFGSYWIYRDITDRKQTEEKIHSSLREKEILIAEIHHRVKNNLQLINSLVNMQQSANKEEHSILNSIKSRIRAISLIHEKLFRTQNVEAIDFSDYLKELVLNLSMAYKRPGLRVHADIRVENVILPLEQATPSSLILNEIISNVYKYGFSGQKSGLLKISFVLKNGEYELTVTNDGPSMPEQALNSKAFGVGMKITHALVRQLKGTLVLDRTEETTFIVRFPKMKPADKQRF